MNEEQLKTELARAYRALRGIYGAVAKGQRPGETMLFYHSPVLAAAIRFVDDEQMDGSSYFEGKPIKLLGDALKGYER
ncbi:MAG: hypothetical protein V4773_11940 [Verrucomicrobiota bacterium]